MQHEPPAHIARGRSTGGGGVVTFLKILVVAALAASPAFAENWRRYHNERFGVSAETPAGWTMGEAPVNDDGRKFSSPDGTAQVVISGMFALDARDEEFARRAEPLDGETVSYAKRGDGWIVLSGLRDGRVFYRKSLLSCGGRVWNDLDIAYPQEDKARYDGIVAHMAASLRAGDGYAITCK
jgi:serine/threonine-protein kinase